MINVKDLKLPETPGVYIFKDRDGKVLYIGKSNNIKKRVKSYFQTGAVLEPRIIAMAMKVCDIEYIQCSNELEATFKEANLIKNVQPQYNIAWKDNKSFLLIAIVYGDDFPYITIKRETDISGNKPTFEIQNLLPQIEYFGPFKNKKDIRASLQVLQSVFKFRTCDIRIFEGDKNRRYFNPCLLYYIKMCSAPCARRIDKKRYLQDISEFKKFLNGNGKELISDLLKQMKFYAKRLQFERAAYIRDKINMLTLINERLDTFGYSTDTFTLAKLNPAKSLEAIKGLFGLKTLPVVIDGIDISNTHGSYATGAVVRFVDGYPQKSEYRRYKIKTVDCSNDIAMMAEVITRRFTRLTTENGVLPHILLLDGGLAHLNMAERVIKKFGVDTFLIALAKYDSNHIYTLKNKEKQRLDPKNIGAQLLVFVRDESHRFAQLYHKILRKNSISL